MDFEPGGAKARIDKLWRSSAWFGRERDASDVFLNEIVSDRYSLVRGLQLLRDELQFAGWCEGTGAPIEACGADPSLPSAVTTIAHTNCGDRIHQGEVMTIYQQLVAARFATLSEAGELKVEKFSPTGGGTDDGATLAHVTVAHQLDEPLRRLLYRSNRQSCVLVGIDLMTHVGRLDEKGATEFGRTRESPWRAPRAACGAIVGAIEHYNPENGVHRRLRRDLGEENFAHLLKHRVATDEGIDITAVVAASIVAVRGMRNVLDALTRELDERGIGHVTASLTVNRVGQNDTLVYLARGTSFAGEVKLQGLGTQAAKYAGRLAREGDRPLELAYGGSEGTGMAVGKRAYEVRSSSAPLKDSRRLLESEDGGEVEIPPMGQTLGTAKPELPTPRSGTKKAPRSPGAR